MSAPPDWRPDSQGVFTGRIAGRTVRVLPEANGRYCVEISGRILMSSATRRRTSRDPKALFKAAETHVRKLPPLSPERQDIAAKVREGRSVLRFIPPTQAAWTCEILRYVADAIEQGKM